MKSLPNPIKPSALIRLARCDEKKAHASSDYTVDMKDWHETSFAGCAVCFAGAVMAFSLGGDPKRKLAPAECDADTRDCLYALNAFRQDMPNMGLRFMGIHEITISPSRSIPPYADDRDAFLAAMESLANELEMIGL